jgi:hypothetical protein
MALRLAALGVLAALVLGFSGCGGGGGGGGGSSDTGPAPFIGNGGSGGDGDGGSGGSARAAAPKAPASLGFPSFATKNTTRVGGTDPAIDAAGVALAVYPSASPSTRPPAVAVADTHDWRAATAAAALMAPPVRAPLLLSDGDKLSSVTTAALRALKPTGARAAGGDQAVMVGSAPPEPPGLRGSRIAGRRADPFALAAAVDRFLAAATGKPSADVVVVGAERAAFGVPAAAWAAKSGDPVLFVRRGAVPAATRAALETHAHPRIFVLGPPASVGPTAVKALEKLGTVTRIAGADPAANAVAFARYAGGGFGWGLTDPGHGVVVASATRPLDGPAGSALASTGTYGPLLLVDRADRLPSALRGFLLDIQPGYRSDPVRGVYNRAWLIGDDTAISVATQARIDQLLEIAPVDTNTR